ncbi:MAG: hypothetical protein V3T40_07450 [Nitrososphaerales archaeon]
MKPTMNEFNQKVMKSDTKPTLMASIAKDMTKDMNTPISIPNKMEVYFFGIRIDNSPSVSF